MRVWQGHNSPCAANDFRRILKCFSRNSRYRETFAHPRRLVSQAIPPFAKADFAKYTPVRVQSLSTRTHSTESAVAADFKTKTILRSRTHKLLVLSKLCGAPIANAAKVKQYCAKTRNTKYCHYLWEFEAYYPAHERCRRRARQILPPVFRYRTRAPGCVGRSSSQYIWARTSARPGEL